MSVPSLESRWDAATRLAFLNGNHALVRLMIDQMRADAAAGLRTRAFVSGYPGSPLGSVDIALKQARAALEAHGITHVPAQNEEFAVSMLSGTQMLDEHPHPDVDGVVGYWYGKGPGLDRSGDALKHANFAGTSRQGAVVILSGEDHEAKSSTVPYQQEFAFEHHGIPVLYPATVQEFLDFGLHAAAMSRYSGCWVALKLVGALCDGGEVVRLGPDRIRPVLPRLEIDGKPFDRSANHRFFPVVNIETERRLYHERHVAALAYATANGLNRVVVSSPNDRIGLIAAGKSFSDTRQALEDLGYDDATLAARGIRLAKVGLLCPADTEFFRRFAEGLEQVVVIEEKRDFLERQVALGLAGLGPVRLLGKRDAAGGRLFPMEGGMTADFIAERLARLLADAGPLPGRGVARLALLQARAKPAPSTLPRRVPNYCSGCPHNVSTTLAPGQVAWGAPGCHLFAALMERPEKRVEATTHFGGEGLPWLGLARYTSRPHVVQNVGDGSLFHSSWQNIRFALTTDANITFKLLINGVLANTGGQEAIGAATIAGVIERLVADGVRKVVLTTKEPEAYRGLRLPAAVDVRTPDRIPEAMAELAATPGVTVIVYDGACANERRRRQKRGLLPAPRRFTIVNEDVCENCGDCGAKANCMSLQKVATEFGPKTQIHQSSCNQDQACVDGECPSFVTVEVAEGTRPARPARPRIEASDLPDPVVPALDGPHHLYLPGLGGTGVLTASAILAQAAALQGLEVRTYDQTGASQKWGAVLSSLILAPAGHIPHVNRVGVAKADLYLALDLLAAVDPANLACCEPGRTRAVINTGVVPSGEVIRDSRRTLPVDDLGAAVAAASSGDGSLWIDARAVAEGLFGDYMMTNMVAIGAASQAGWLPIEPRWIESAIALNGTQVEANVLAFRAGRLWVHDPAQVARRLEGSGRPNADRVAEQAASGADRRHAVALDLLLAGIQGWPPALQERVRTRALDLIEYQDLAYAARYVERVRAMAGRESEQGDPSRPFVLTSAVAFHLHKVMAYKDEYEVARLLTQRSFEQRVAERFDGPVRLSYNLQPPLARQLGLHRKLRIGPWARPLLRALTRLRRLRGTAFDPFGRMASRRDDRAVRDWYEGCVDQALALCAPARVSVLLELLELPGDVRGYEHLKHESFERARGTAERLIASMPNPIRRPAIVLAQVS